MGAGCRHRFGDPAWPWIGSARAARPGPTQTGPDRRAGVGTATVPGHASPGLHLFVAAYAGTETHSPSETPVVPLVVRAD